jgi:hypothetical protein
VLWLEQLETLVLWLEQLETLVLWLEQLETLVLWLEQLETPVLWSEQRGTLAPWSGQWARLGPEWEQWGQVWIPELSGWEWAGRLADWWGDSFLTERIWPKTHRLHVLVSRAPFLAIVGRFVRQSPHHWHGLSKRGMLRTTVAL